MTRPWPCRQLRLALALPPEIDAVRDDVTFEVLPDARAMEIELRAKGEQRGEFTATTSIPGTFVGAWPVATAPHAVPLRLDSPFSRPSPRSRAKRPGSWRVTLMAVSVSLPGMAAAASLSISASTFPTTTLPTSIGRPPPAAARPSCANTAWNERRISMSASTRRGSQEVLSRRKTAGLSPCSTSTSAPPSCCSVRCAVPATVSDC